MRRFSINGSSICVLEINSFSCSGGCNEAASFTIGEAASITFKLATSLTLLKVPQSHSRGFKAKVVYRDIVCVDLV